jgi:putative ABC transport system permease protein
MVSVGLRVLDRKLLRDLWRLRVQAVSVVLVLACGLAVFVMAIGMRASLERTRAQYYETNKMADLAVSIVRAPDRMLAQLARAPGIAAAEARISGYALLDLPGVIEPVSARLVSLPPQGRPAVNDLTLVTGRWPDPARAEEVLLNQAFADATGLSPGKAFSAVMHGRRTALKVVGVANSPEFVFVAAPGELFPQPERFGIVWMGRKALGRAYDLDGAFNEAVFRLARGGDERAARAAIDRLLAAYGSTGAHGRDLMISDRYLSEELNQLATMAVFLPTLFLLVAAFLVTVSLGRVIATERANIGLMKAFGYGDAAVAFHYAKSAFALAILGALLGSFAGIALGRWVADIYQKYYHFPELRFAAPVSTYVWAWAAGMIAAGGGAAFAVRRAARMAPAAALAPPRPPTFVAARGVLAQWGTHLDAKSRIIARRILRFPQRAATTVIGIALAVALLVVARTFPAVMDYMLNVHFGLANRQDVTLSFTDPREAGIMHEIERLPGVVRAEPFRIDAVEFSNAQWRVQETIVGVDEDAGLNRVLDRNGAPIAAPADGLILAKSLAARLHVRPGDSVHVQQTQGQRRVQVVRVARVIEPMIGSSAYMDRRALSRLMAEPNRIAGVHIALDMARYAQFNAALKRTPSLAGASFLKLAEASMRRNFEEGVGVMNLMYAAFAAVMAGGVAFSAARVTFAEQERDLATLRVLGLTRGEVSYILIGEISFLALVAMPLGCLMGIGLAQWLMHLFETDMYAFPFVAAPAGYAFAVTFTLACVAAASLLVRRQIDRLDIVGVLKSRD